MNGPVFIIAEAGVNHNGDPQMARSLIDAALAAGADAVKFQAFKAANLANASAPKADYQADTTGSGESQLEMLRKLELSEDVFLTLADYCQVCGIEFLCTPFDHHSLNFLHQTIGVQRIKVSSGDITNAPLLAAIGATGLPAILSTGMSGLGDVEAALGALACGYLGQCPTEHQRTEAWVSAEGQRLLADRVTLLHCTTEYPAPLEEVNLRAMATLSNAFGLPVGYSDHTPGVVVPVAATALGAVMIEKHFTLDRSLPGPDHRASLEPAELGTMVEHIRTVEQALENGIKALARSETKNVSVARKSLVAARAIHAGERFSAENIAVKRPGDGVSPMAYWEYLGREAGRDYGADEIIAE